MNNLLFYRKWLWANGYLYAGTEKYKGPAIDVPCLQEAVVVYRQHAQKVPHFLYNLHKIRPGIVQLAQKQPAHRAGCTNVIGTPDVVCKHLDNVV